MRTALNPYRPIESEVVQVTTETPTIKTLRLKPREQIGFRPGQFIELTVPGGGEAPFTPSSHWTEQSEMDVTVMRVGRVTDRIHQLKTGDVVGLRGPFGTGYDLVLVSNICHMLSPEQNRDLLLRCGNALEPGGRVVIQDFILDEDRAGPSAAALFAINMLVATEKGSSYSDRDYTEWLAEAGFADGRRVAMPGPTDLILATKSGSGR